MQRFNLSGKKAIVFGATGAIGQACAEALLEVDCQVVIVGRNPDKLILTQESLRKQFPKGQFECATVDTNSIENLANFYQNHSEARIVVNSVGVNQPRRLEEVDEENFDWIMDTNVKQAFFITQKFVSMVRKGKSEDEQTPASIIHISSQMGLIGGFERSVYCGSKHALEGFSKAIAIEIGEWGMRINTICPTFIETELTKSTLSDPAKRDIVMDALVIKRLSVVDDLKGGVIYLASDSSSMVTATALKVDGGWTAK